MTNKTNLSVVLATKNEESNIGPCLESVSNIASEIIVVDEFSTDKTIEIAKSYGAKVFSFRHKTNFHETKQHAINEATGDWILQLDADERVTDKLAIEVVEVIKSSSEKLLERTPRRWPNGLLRGGERKKFNLFARHQKLIEIREGRLGKQTGEVVAFFIPRVNIFMGKPLIHGGVYPDGVIRLFKKGYAHLPAKSVHELMEVDGDVGWLFNDLEHHDSPTFARYLKRNERYIEILADDFKKQNLPRNSIFYIQYSIFKPIITFINLYVRHKGFLDGWRGFVWAFFSALRFPRAYGRYLKTND